MDELHKCLAEGNFNKLAGLMKARVADMEQQLEDAERRLSRLEAPDHHFIEATLRAPVVASIHLAPRTWQ